MKLKTYLILLCLAFGLHAKQNLEDLAQDFVLESKQIKLKELPHAFNPSIIRYKGRLLMSFRVIPDKKQPFNSWLGLVWLDDNFKQASQVQLLEQLRDPGSKAPHRMEDGRLIIIDNKLLLIYSDNEDEQLSRGGFRMYVAELEEKEGIFSVVHKERLTHFDGSSILRREKSWTPFEYENKLLLSYSLSPHKIFAPKMGTNSCIMIAQTENELDWKWGELRGGTPALKQDDHYLGFFHSCIKLDTVHCKKNAPHYFMGAYLLEKEYPFCMTHISKRPIIGKNFYEGKNYRPYWGTVQVVFPGGYVQNDEHIWLVYGRQDHEMWVTKLDKAKLYQEMVPVKNSMSESTRFFFSKIKDIVCDLFEFFFGSDNS